MIIGYAIQASNSKKSFLKNTQSSVFLAVAEMTTNQESKPSSQISFEVSIMPCARISVGMLLNKMNITKG